MPQAEHEFSGSAAWTLVQQMENTLLKVDSAIEAMQQLLNPAVREEEPLAATSLNWALDRMREHRAELDQQHSKLFHLLNPLPMPTPAAFRHIASA